MFPPCLSAERVMLVVIVMPREPFQGLHAGVLLSVIYSYC